MSNYTSLGEWSDSEEDDLIRNIDEEAILRGLFGNNYIPKGTEEWSDSEDDERIRNINEDAILRCINEEQTRRGEKRKTLSDTEEEPFTKRNNAFSSDTDPTSVINDEGSTTEDDLEHEQTGQGKKRKAETQDMEQEQEYYRIQPVKEHYSNKFKAMGKNYRVQFNNTLDNVDLLQSQTRTYDIFDRLIKDVTEGMNSTDQVRFVLQSNQLQSPISLPFCALEELTTEKVFSQVEKVVQSNEEFRLNDAVNIDILCVQMPQGSGKNRSRRTTYDLREYLKKKGSVICINNKDNYCLARALAVSIARIEKDPQYNQIRDSSRHIQFERALALHQAAHVPFDIPCGLKEVDLFQQHLINYQIIVVSGDQNNAIIYPHKPPANPNPEKSIYLYYQANHFDVITTLPGFLNTSYFCHVCHKGYDHTTDHLCDGMCKSCRGVGCTLENHGIICKECDRFFFNQACYDRHKQEPINGGGRTMCETVRKCPECKKSIDVAKLKNHQCIDNKTCTTCKVKCNPSDPNHKCYMQQEQVKEEPSYAQLLFFDFECTQEHGIHEPNLCVVYDEEREVAIFRGKNTVKDFCKWLFTPEHDQSIVIAHNFQGYDSYFILKHLDQEAIPYEVIYNGAKCMTLTTKRKGKKRKQFAVEIKFIDSLNFIPMALARFPKTFGLDELCKGYFPHYFNKDENQEYVGPIPCQEDYGANAMKPEAREKFLTWHQEQVESNYVFDFQKEILKYCRSDVDILAECCKLYREMFMHVTDTTHDDTGLDPFDSTITIAAYCMQVYRTKFLKKDTIALFPQHQELKRTQSHEALQWLSYTADKEGIHIQHHRNGGEKRVENYYLDGYCEETHTAYEYQGCYWHGKNACIQ